VIADEMCIKNHHFKQITTTSPQLAKTNNRLGLIGPSFWTAPLARHYGQEKLVPSDAPRVLRFAVVAKTTLLTLFEANKIVFAAVSPPVDRSLLYRATTLFIRRADDF
jgi:hypothetical protein